MHTRTKKISELQVGDVVADMGKDWRVASVDVTGDDTIVRGHCVCLDCKIPVTFCIVSPNRSSNLETVDVREGGSC